jgi:predicted amidohydrolase YtcJ
LAKKLARLGIIVVTQPPFIYYSGDRYLCTVSSEKFQHLYPIKTLMENGVAVAGSSDCPIVPPNPLIGIGAAVSRLSKKGAPVLESEGISPLEALKIYTLNAAMAGFEENVRGSITPGKVADMVVLSDDPTTSAQLSEIKVEKTILGGRIAWEK